MQSIFVHQNKTAGLGHKKDRDWKKETKRDIKRNTDRKMHRDIIKYWLNGANLYLKSVTKTYKKNSTV